MSKRSHPPHRTCKVIGFKAFHDTDADLLDWWDGIEEGDRSNTLRDLIREQLGKQAKTARQPKRSEAALPFAELERVRDDTTWIREALNGMPAYLEGILQQAFALQPGTQVPAVEGVISSPPVPDLTEQDTIRREVRMRKAKW